MDTDMVGHGLGQLDWTISTTQLDSTELSTDETTYLTY